MVTFNMSHPGLLEKDVDIQSLNHSSELKFRALGAGPAFRRKDTAVTPDSYRFSADT